MKSIYSDCKSDLLRRGETLFPFSCFSVSVDWVGVLAWLEGQEWEGDEEC